MNPIKHGIPINCWDQYTSVPISPDSTCDEQHFYNVITATTIVDVAVAANLTVAAVDWPVR